MMRIATVEAFRPGEQGLKIAAPPSATYAGLARHRKLRPRVALGEIQAGIQARYGTEQLPRPRLHGGSGLLTRLPGERMPKMNIDTDAQYAHSAARSPTPCRRTTTVKVDGEVNKKVYDPRSWGKLPPSRPAAPCLPRRRCLRP
jgi:hypothetical protein